MENTMCRQLRLIKEADSDLTVSEIAMAVMTYRAERGYVPATWEKKFSASLRFTKDLLAHGLSQAEVMELSLKELQEEVQKFEEKIVTSLNRNGTVTVKKVA